MRFPIFIENSRVPIWLSKVAPIEIYAVSFMFWVFSRGPISDRLRRHEAIHYLQQREMLFIFQHLAYICFWLYRFAIHRDGARAYKENPFEVEAYTFQNDEDILTTRRSFEWARMPWGWK